MDFTAHPTAIIDEGAQIGAGSRIWHWVHVCAGARIGRGCLLGQNAFIGNRIGNRVSIGDNVKNQNNVSVYDGATPEDDVFWGLSMVFTKVHNTRSAVSRKHEYRPRWFGRAPRSAPTAPSSAALPSANTPSSVRAPSSPKTSVPMP